MNKIFFSFSIITLIFSCAGGQSSGKDLAVLGLYSSPQKIIETLETEKANFADHYLLARAYLEKNDNKKAIYHFANSAFVYHRAKNLRLFAGPVYKFLNEFHIKSDYYDDAVYAIAKIFNAYREYEHVIKLIDLMEENRTALYRDALVLKCKALVELKQHQNALQKLREALTLFNDKNTNALLHIRMASTYAHVSDEKNALDEYFKAIEASPESWHASVAAEQLLLVAKKNTVSLENPKKITLACALYRAKKYEDALAFFSEANIPDEAVELYLKTLVRLKRFDDAEKIIQKSQARNKDRNFTRIFADELWDGGNQALAAAKYHLLANHNDEIARHAHARLCIYSEKRKIGNFQAMLSDFITKYPNEEQYSYISWLLARSFIRNGDYHAALPVIEKSLRDAPEGKYSDHHRFWLYRTRALSGKKEELQSILIDMIEKNPDSSYTWSLLDSVADTIDANEITSKLDACDSDRCRLLHHALLTVKESNIEKRNARLKKYSFADRRLYDDIEKAIASLSLRSDYEKNLKNLKKYFAVGDADSIARELSFLPDDDEVKNDSHIAVAHYAEQYGFFHRSAFATLQLFRAAKLPVNLFLMDAKTISRIYPKAYDACVKNAARSTGFDIPTLYAIIRAESMYHHEANSPAGAVGLMQIMPATARGIAKELSLDRYDLKDPCTSITMGAHYFKNLSKMYKGKIELMIAAYNAGPGNVAKWMEKYPTDDLHFFIEQVPFDETRYYMLRTKKNYLQGKLVYEKE